MNFSGVWMNMTRPLRRMGLLLGAVILFSPLCRLQALDLGTVTYVGEGANTSYLVIDWGGEGQSFVWGYKWNGTTQTTLNMLTAIAASDTRLYLNIQDVTLLTGAQKAVYGLGFNVTGSESPFNTTPIGIEEGSANDPGNFYAEGWEVSGFWNVYKFTGSEANGYSPYDANGTPVWTERYEAAQGDEGIPIPYTGTECYNPNDLISENLLQDQTWKGFTFAKATVDSETGEKSPGLNVAPSNPVAAPEPSAVALVVLGAFTLLASRRVRVGRKIED